MLDRAEISLSAEAAKAMGSVRALRVSDALNAEVPCRVAHGPIAAVGIGETLHASFRIGIAVGRSAAALAAAGALDAHSARRVAMRAQKCAAIAVGCTRCGTTMCDRVADLARNRSAIRITDALDAGVRRGIAVRRAAAALSVTRTLRALVRRQVARSAIGAVRITKTLDANVARAIRRRLRALTITRA